MTALPRIPLVHGPTPIVKRYGLDELTGVNLRIKRDDVTGGAESGNKVRKLEWLLGDATGRRADTILTCGGLQSNGSLGYVEWMRETAAQMHQGLAGGDAPFDVIVHACGSGGTAAGIALGAARFNVAKSVRAMAVCNDAAYFQEVIARVVNETRSWDASLREAAPLVVDDVSKGLAHAVSSPEQRERIVRVARTSGLVLDPVYGGKAMHGLQAAVERRDSAAGARVLFVHTGGLPGLLAKGDAFGAELT